MEKRRHRYLFSTTCSENGLEEDEFAVELFEYEENFDCNGPPLKKIRNFDELVDFFEEWEDE